MKFSSLQVVDQNVVGGGATAVAPAGQAFYGFGSGTYSWTCPPGVFSVCVVAIGGGAGNNSPSGSGAGGGGGGGLGWKNNISVTPGTVYTVVVGQGGDYLQGGTYPGGSTSYFISSAIVAGVGATGYTGGGYVGDGGGNGGNGATSQAGGGAGGYTGAGGNSQSPGAGGGGAGGWNYSSTWGWASGGGVGPFGQGTSGSLGSYAGGGGGSGGEDGFGGENGWTSRGHRVRHGGLYGGGSGGCGDNLPDGYGLNRGGRGCVRIIWGTGRFFPSTGTGDM